MPFNNFHDKNKPFPNGEDDRIDKKDEHFVDTGHDDVDLSLWDNKRDNPEDNATSTFTNKTYTAIDVPETNDTPNEGETGVDTNQDSTKQDEVVNDMIDLLANPDS